VVNHGNLHNQEAILHGGIATPNQSPRQYYTTQKQLGKASVKNHIQSLQLGDIHKLSSNHQRVIIKSVEKAIQSRLQIEVQNQHGIRLGRQSLIALASRGNNKITSMSWTLARKSGLNI